MNLQEPHLWIDGHVLNKTQAREASSGSGAACEHADLLQEPEAPSDAFLRVHRKSHQSWSLWLEEDSGSPRSHQEPGLTMHGLSHEAHGGPLAFVWDSEDRTICAGLLGKRQLQVTRSGLIRGHAHAVGCLR